MKKIFSVFLRVGISIILLFFLFRQVDRRSLGEIIKNADKGLLFIAFLTFLTSNILALFRWSMLLKAVEIELPLKRVAVSYAGGVFFSLFLPTSIGGDLMRSIDLAQHTKKPGEVIATVFLDRLSGYIGLVFLAVISLFLGRNLVQDKSIFISVGIIIAILVAILLVLFNKSIYSKISSLLHSPNAGKIREVIKDLHKEIHFFRHHKKVIFNNLLLSVVIQGLSPVTFFIIASAIGLKLNILYFFIFTPIISAITLLPISIGGLGLRDATTILLFAKVGVSRDLAFAMSLLNFSFIVLCGAIGGLIYVLTVHHRRIQYTASSAAGPNSST